MKTGADALVSAENESGGATHEMRLDTLDTAENESGRTKHEIGS
jgi:hypothetical protein